MLVKELLDRINTLISENKISLDTQIIVNGEYNFGDDIDSIDVLKMAKLNYEEVEEQLQDVLYLGIDNYLYDTDSLGEAIMWVDEDSLGDFYEIYNCEDEEEDTIKLTKSNFNDMPEDIKKDLQQVYPKESNNEIS